MKYVGKEYDRVDGPDKIRGRAMYVDDYQFEGMLHVAVVRSSVPHALVRNIDFSGALMEGVVGTFTYEDFPGDCSYGFPVCDNHLLSVGEVRYRGDAIAVVCAETREAARIAASKVRVEYESLPAVFDVDEATELLNKLVVKKNPEEAKKCGDDLVTVEMSMSTKHQEHMYIEPEGAAAWMENGILQVVAPMQSPLAAKGILCKAMNLPSNKLRVVQSTVGGAFGGKDDVVYEACGFAALAAFKTGRPCKYVASREESVVSSYKRHPVKCSMKLAASKDGTFQGMKARIRMDGGAYASVSNFVQYRNTTHCAGPYVYSWIDAENESYYTNNVYSAAFRGFGGLQACFFYDTVVDEMAWKLNMDPIELRLKNVWSKGKTTATGELVKKEVALSNMLMRMRQVSCWDEKRQEFRRFNETHDTVKKGIGVSVGYHGVSLGAEGEDFAQSQVVYNKEKNNILVTCGISELGQGSRTVFSQIASEVLELPQSFIEVNNYDTDVILDSGPTVASRGSTVGGNAVKWACEKFMKLLKERLAKLENVEASAVEYRDGMFYVQSQPVCEILQLCRQLSRQEKVQATARFDMPKIDWNEENGLGMPYVSYHYGVHACHLTVNVATGTVKVDEYYSIHDVGKVINPSSLRGQMTGGVVMGMGYALMEDLNLQEGVIGNRNFDQYVIPTSADVPKIHAEAFEQADIGPYGAKGTGEPVLTPVPACIGNALRFALGRRLADLPFSLERVSLGKELHKHAK